MKSELLIFIFIFILLMFSIYIYRYSEKKAKHKKRKLLIEASENIEGMSYFEKNQPAPLVAPVMPRPGLFIEEKPTNIKRERIITNLRERLFKELAGDGHEHLVFAIKAGQTDMLSLSDKDTLLKYSRKIRGLSVSKATVEYGMAGPSSAAGGAGWISGLRE